MVKEIIEEQDKFFDYVDEMKNDSDCKLYEYDFYEWYNKVQLRHKGIRKLIDSNIYRLNINFNVSHKALDDKEFSPLISIIEKEIPNIRESLSMHCGKSIKDINKPILQIFDHNHKFIKTSTFLTNAFKYRHRAKNINKNMSDCLTKLGELWNKYSTKPCNIVVELDTTGIGFLSLGSYNGVDQESCFGIGGGSEHHKILLGEIKDSYTVKFFEKNTLIARAFGALTNGNILNFCNFYFRRGIHYGNIYTGLKLLYANIFNEDAENVIETMGQFRFSDIYQNEPPSVSYCNKEVKAKQTI